MTTQPQVRDTRINRRSRSIKTRCALGILASFGLIMSGCQTDAQTGGLAGAGIGALAGQAIGSSTEATLIGAAVGGGIGYIIGNEKDKEHAREMSYSSQRSSQPVSSHSEVGQLGGSRWNLVSLLPEDVADPFVSKTVDFRQDGRVVTTTTFADGGVDVSNENYRVVGDTLVINKPGYLINARFRLSNDQLIVNAEDFAAVLQRLD